MAFYNRHYVGSGVPLISWLGFYVMIGWILDNFVNLNFIILAWEVIESNYFFGLPQYNDGHLLCQKLIQELMRQILKCRTEK